MDPNGRTALVTGGAQGIGKGIARALLKRGARVVIANLDPEIAAATVAELSTLGPIRALRCDVSSRAAVDTMLDDIEASEGPADLVFCNAGYGGAAPLVDMPFADVERLFAVNFFSAVHLTQSWVSRQQAAGRGGHLMFTGSENSLVMPAYLGEMAMGMYGATKHAMLVYAEWLRHELAGTGIEISVLLPGPVLTERLAEAVAADPAEVGRNPMNDPDSLLRRRFISTDTCGEIAMAGLKKGLFFIPTHGYIREDVQRRHEELAAAFDALGFEGAEAAPPHLRAEEEPT